MKNLKYYIGCLILIQQFQTQIYSQDVVYSSFDYTNGMVNPALTAESHGMQFTAGTRNQWKKFGGSYNTLTASGEFAFKKNENKSYLASGIDFYTDNSVNGALTTNSIKTNLAYHLQIDGYEKLSVGMYLGYLGFTTNLDKERWGSQYDGMNYNSGISSGESFSGTTKSALDVGFGVVYSSKMELSQKTPTFQIGLSAYHLNHPNISIINDQENRLPVRLSGFINTSYLLFKSKVELKPSINMQFQNEFFYMIVGSMATLQVKSKIPVANPSNLTESFSAGLFYRSSGALISRISYQKSVWNIGLSYDINFGSKSGIGSMRSATEINLRYSIR